MPRFPHLTCPFPWGPWLQRCRQTKVPNTKQNELREKNGKGGGVREKALFLLPAREGRWERHVTLSHERF